MSFLEGRAGVGAEPGLDVEGVQGASGGGWVEMVRA